jgi:RNA polymerase sigma-70 factor (ECF subfamily)
LINFATSIIGNRAQAEEVVQDAWQAVYSGVGASEGRSSLVALSLRIVLNRARTRATRERRLVGLSILMEGTNSGVRADNVPEIKREGGWIEASRLRDDISPERIVGGRQLWDHVLEAIDRLPCGQRDVIVIWCDTEPCEGQGRMQAVQLHRARIRIRQPLDAAIGAPSVARGRAGAAIEPL